MSASIWAVVPVKPLNRAKSRLASVLSPSERQDLAVEMLHHHLAILNRMSGIAGILVISRDNQLLSLAQAYPSVEAMQENGSPELNSALRQATSLLSAWGASASLILPADMPLVTQDDIEAIIKLGQSTRNCLVITPDRHQQGTNALLLSPPTAIPFRFGKNSFQTHQHLAQQASVKIFVHASDNLALDVDTPDDLRYYLKVVQQIEKSPMQSLNLANAENHAL